MAGEKIERTEEEGHIEGMPELVHLLHPHVFLKMHLLLGGECD